MGQQYVLWLRQLGYVVTTVDLDSNRKADYLDYNEAIKNRNYDIIYIGTPNWTHESIAKNVVTKTRILFIEKPGFIDSSSWKNFLHTYNGTRISMIKNNQHRLEISGFYDLLKISKQVNVIWSRKNGIPTSSWFKERNLSFGGVSRDLMTHLLSYYTILTHFEDSIIINSNTKDLNNTGIDDFCEIEIKNNNTIWKFNASWKNTVKDEHYIEFDFGVNRARFELGDNVTAFGGCPAYAYSTMIDNAVKNINNDFYWENQMKQDIWIHEQVENL